MNLHSNLRYPFWKFVIEEFSGVFYEDEFTSLNRLLILYHNRYVFSVKPTDVDEFLDLYEAWLSRVGRAHWWLSADKRARIQQIKSRSLFVLQRNRGIFERLLSRKDYASSDAVNEALESIFSWLQTLPTEAVYDKTLDLEGWKRDLAEFATKTKSRELPLKAISSTLIGEFQDQFSGESVEERRVKFQKLKHVLLENQWIVPISDTDTYRYCRQTKGGRLYIAALYFVLFEQKHIEKMLDAPQIADLFNTWLIHDFERSSFVKGFQAEELNQFNCTKSSPRYKYVTEVRLMLQNF